MFEFPLQKGRNTLKNALKTRIRWREFGSAVALLRKPLHYAISQDTHTAFSSILEPKTVVHTAVALKLFSGDNAVTAYAAQVSGM